MQREGVLTGKGNRGWSTSALSVMLRSRVYLGEAFSGRYVQPGAHPALTDPATWHAVRHEPNLRRYEQKHALLAGLARCASCRHMLMPFVARPPGRTPYLNYRCRKMHAAGPCIAPAIICSAKLEPYVIEAALTVLRNRRRLPAARLMAASEHADAAAESLARYRDNDRIATLVGEQRFLDGLAVRQERVRNANLDLVALQARVGIYELPPLDDMRRLLTELPLVKRRHLIGRVIDMVFVAPGRGSAAERVTVCPAGTAPRLLPRQGDRGHVNPPHRAAPRLDQPATADGHRIARRR
jgi:hypothetical protein